VATLREIRHRISGIKSTQKITKAMKMVAAAKLRRAQESIIAARPYAKEMDMLLRHLAAKLDPSLHPLLLVREIRRTAVVIVAGERGLCGAFNGNIMKAANEYIKKESAVQLKESGVLQIMTVGRKAQDSFGKRYDLFAKFPGIFNTLHFGYAREIVQEITGGYLQGKFDKVIVIYNEFKSVIQQQVKVEQFLPILPEDLQGRKDLRTLSQVDYIYEPTCEEIVNNLIPKHLNFQMWRVLLESAAAEQGARMTAMSNATENATELLDELTLSYNKARQAGITTELTEIVSGAETLKKAG
jgi:F-type H+-transporting ATPase subunit gamma